MSKKSQTIKKTWRQQAIASATPGIIVAMSMLGASLGISTSGVAHAAGNSNASSPGNGMKTAPPTAKPKITQDVAKDGIVDKQKSQQKNFKKMDEYIRQ